MFDQEHDVIIHYNSTTCIGNFTEQLISDSTDTLYSTTCEASENGVACWHHADLVYTTSEGIDKHLCKQCYGRMWGVALKWHKARVQTLEEEGQVA
jgi:hypothetical protein